MFAFGAVVYEMLTGQKAFDGSSQASLIAAILDTDPPAPSTLQPMTPPALDRVVKKCLVKDPDGRWQSAGDLADNLRWLRADSPAPHGEMPPARPLPDSAHARRMWRVAGVGLLLTLGATGWWFWAGSRTAPPTPVSVTHTQVTFNGDVVDEALSPDGRTVAYAVGVQSNGVRVLVRDLAGGEALEIWQGQGISTLHWTPDGAQLLVSGVPDQGPRQVVLIPRLGGPPRRVAALNAPFMAVSPDGSQLMGALENEQGFRVAPMTGGEIHRVELPDIRFVHDVAWDPDGKLVAVVGRDDDGTPAVWP